MSIQTRSRLFAPSLHHQPLSALFLIENSVSTSRVWSDLKDQALSKLLHMLLSANTSAPHISVSFLETCPDQGHSSQPFSPRQYSDPFVGLDNVNFGYSAENRISPSVIDHCIRFLESSNPTGQPMAQHLFIVASTTPSQDVTGTTFSSNGYSPWVMLARKLAQANIHCHLVYSPQEDLSGLSMMFEEAVHLRGNVEEVAPFPTDVSRFVCRLSSRPPFETYTSAASGSGIQVQRTERNGPTRRNSFPLDNFYPDAHTPSHGAELDQPPSLVSQLQQVHGLTKKKVYGSKPVRAPFFKDEPVLNDSQDNASVAIPASIPPLPIPVPAAVPANVNVTARDRYRGKGPAPLTMPPSFLETMAASSSGGKAMSQSRVDRKLRIGQSSPVDSSRRPMAWPRRMSGLSTPEPDILPSSTTTYADTSPGGSYISSDFSSPVTPASTSDEYYGVATQNPVNMAPSMAQAPHQVYSNLPTPESQWTQQPIQYGSPYASIQSTTYFSNATGAAQAQYTYPPSVNHFDSFVGDVAAAPAPVPTSVVSRAPLPATLQPATSATSTPLPTATHIASSTARHHRTSSQSKKNDDDDERFMFTKEFVAATASMFEEEVLPAYPNYPGASSGLFTSGISPQLSAGLPASRVGELYASKNRCHQTASGSQPSTPNPNVPFMTSSSIVYAQPRGGHVDTTSGQSPSSEVYTSDVVYQPSYGSSTSSLVGWAG